MHTPCLSYSQTNYNRCFLLRFVFTCWLLLAAFSVGNFQRVLFTWFLFFKYGLISTKQKQSANPTVRAITLRIPSFMQCEIQLCVTLVQLDFANRRITSDVNRLRYFVSRFSPDVTPKVMDVILYSRSCDALKDAVISRPHRIRNSASDSGLKSLRSGITGLQSHCRRCSVSGSYRPAPTRWLESNGFNDSRHTSLHFSVLPVSIHYRRPPK